jgi:hypothetical protein
MSITVTPAEFNPFFQSAPAGGGRNCKLLADEGLRRGAEHRGENLHEFFGKDRRMLESRFPRHIKTVE